MSRERIQVFQMDSPVCEHTFGVAPCTATAASPSDGSECYNTRKTCQDTVNYSEITQRLYWVTECEAVYVSGGISFPTLQNVSRQPAELNIVSVDPDKAPLGKRESVKINLRDHPHHDRAIDPYFATRTYVDDVLTQGTFWTKFQARHDNLDGIACKVYEGYAGQSLCEMRTYHYILDRIDGPGSSDIITVTVKDILKAADNARVKVPATSTGKLLADITDLDGTFDLEAVGSPSTAGDDYPTAGTVDIGGEIIEFTRSGDTFTAVERGAYGTTAAAHTAGDVVQLCFDTKDRTASPPAGKRIEAIVQDILLNYVGVPAEWITTADWTAEADSWIPTYLVDTVIPKPTGANQLIGELLRDSATYLIPDSRNKRIHFRALSPDPVTKLITEDDNIILNSFKIVRKPELKISQLFYWYDIADVTGNVKDLNNFNRVYVDNSDDQARVRQQRQKTITSRWLQSSNIGEITDTADRIMTRYGVDPIEFHLQLDSKDNDLNLGDTFAIQHRSYTDETGAPVSISMQIISMQELDRGNKLAIKAQPFEFDFAARLIPPDTVDVWTSATDEEKEKYLFLSDDNGEMSDGSDGPTLV